MSIYLIRHGNTAGNAERRLQVPETPLNETGLEQAAKLADRLRDAGIERILSSDLTRAYQTAEAVSATTGVQIEPTSLLQERNFGDHRGMLYRDVGPDLFTAAYVPSNGETTAEFHGRVRRAWEHVTGEAEGMTGNLAVVTHGLVYGELLLSCLELPAEVGRSEALPTQVRNTAVTVIEARPPWKVSLLACANHLEPVSPTRVG
jgi:broad specificity phosphatase PhoE